MKRIKLAALVLLSIVLIAIILARLNVEAAASAEPCKHELYPAATIASAMASRTREVAEFKYELPKPRTFYEAIPLSEEVQSALFESCKKYGIEPALAVALIQTESRFQEDAYNPSGCYGLCQLNPAYFPTGLSPADNVRYGLEYLSRCINTYGSVEAGLTAYNVGHDNGTRTYANVVLSAYAEWYRILEG